MKKSGTIIEYKREKVLLNSDSGRLTRNDIEWTEEEYAEAFAWVLDLQKLNNWHSEPVTLNLVEGDVEEVEKHGCILSFFIDRKNNRAILRRDWPEEMCLKISKLMNFKELEENMPEGTLKMLRNGLNLYYTEGRNYFKTLYLAHKKEVENKH